jgi:hypothetical protein
MDKDLATPLMLANMVINPDRVDYAVIDNLLYVSISPRSHNIWRTDGTECGTVEIYTGAASSFPIAPIGNDMIMGGESNYAGREPHIYFNISDIPSPCFEPAVAFSSEAAEEKVITPYPNPFTSNFTLRINGDDNESATVGVYTTAGLPIEKLEGVKMNTAYPNMGNNWPKGMYFVKVNKGGKITSHTIIKK